METAFSSVGKVNQEPTQKYDAFISYSRRDKQFADLLEKALEAYKPPKDLDVPQRHLRIFRDEQDFTGPEYHRSLDKHLQESAKLIVICSPAARQSPFVCDEIQRFLKVKHADHIIPILLSGIPNNKAKPGQDHDLAFPQPLYEALGLPLAADYRGFEGKKEKVNKGRWWDAWHKILADLYGKDRSEIEQREANRDIQTRNRWIAAGLFLIAMLSSLSVWALIERKEAKRQEFIAKENAAEAETRRKEAVSRQLAMQANKFKKTKLDLALLLSLEAFQMNQTKEASGALTTSLASSPHLRTILHDHTGPVRSVAFRPPHGQIFATAGDDGTVRLWDAKGKKLLNNLVDQNASIRTVAFSQNGAFLAFGDVEGTIQILNVENPGKPKSHGSELSGHTGAVRCIAFSPQGNLLASAGHDGTIRIWNLINGKPRGHALTDHQAPVESVAFSPDGTLLASGDVEGMIRLWKVEVQGPYGHVFSNYGGAVRSVAFSPNNNLLASADDSGKIQLWNVEDQSHHGFTFYGHSASVRSIAFSPDGTKLVSGGIDRTLRLWNVENQMPLGPPLTSHTYSVRSVAFSPDGETLVSTSVDGTVRIWDVTAKRAPREPLTGHPAAVWSVAYGPKGKVLASAGANGEIWLWDLERRTPFDVLDDHTDGVWNVAISPNGKVLASGGDDGTVRLWILGEKNEPLGPPITDHKSLVASLAFSPSGKILASAGGDHVVRLWNVEDREPLGKLGPHQGPVWAVAFSPKGNLLASAGLDRTVRLWELDEDESLNGQINASVELGSHTSLVSSVAFSPNGETLASAGEDGVRLWDVEQGEQISTLHTGPAWSIAFHPENNQLLASLGLDHVVRLWNVGDQKPLGALHHDHTFPVWAIAFSPDGKTLASAGDDQTIRLFDGNINFEDMSATPLKVRACTIANRNLSKEEWRKYLGDDYRETCPGLG